MCRRKRFASACSEARATGCNPEGLDPMEVQILPLAPCRLGRVARLAVATRGTQVRLLQATLLAEGQVTAGRSRRLEESQATCSSGASEARDNGHTSVGAYGRLTTKVAGVQPQEDDSSVGQVGGTDGW